MPIHPPVADAAKITLLLLERGVEFILVGGAAAIIHGSTVNTTDYDVVHGRSPTNVARLLAVIAELDGFFRTDLGARRIAPGADHLSGHGQILLSTTAGPIDLLCELHDGRGYDELLPNTVVLDAGGRPLRVIDLPTLIEVKAAAGRPKDRIAVAELLALLDRKA